mmetsp:Transcript_39194/g.125945  ORF Transcript_39194/g.125945 Transcript_39194/m.125945 type:complete len:93 (-) Transcript_39194:115-393(-)
MSAALMRQTRTTKCMSKHMHFLGVRTSFYYLSHALVFMILELDRIMTIHDLASPKKRRLELQQLEAVFLESRLRLSPVEYCHLFPSITQVLD